jgi:hypothetical protein
VQVIVVYCFQGCHQKELSQEALKQLIFVLQKKYIWALQLGEYQFDYQMLLEALPRTAVAYMYAEMQVGEALKYKARYIGIIRVRRVDCYRHVPRTFSVLQFVKEQKMWYNPNLSKGGNHLPLTEHERKDQVQMLEERTVKLERCFSYVLRNKGACVPLDMQLETGMIDANTKARHEARDAARKV